MVAEYWSAAEARDWPQFGSLLDEQVVYEAPQSRERVRGREAYVRFNTEGFPGEWHLRVLRIVSEDRNAVSWIEFSRPDQAPETGLCFFVLSDDGLITGITDFWPEPYEVPANRTHLIERY